MAKKRLPRSDLPRKKRCTRCKTIKRQSEYYILSRKGFVDVLASRCKICTLEVQREVYQATPLEVRTARNKARVEASFEKRRVYKLKVNYNLTAEQFDQMVKDQEGKCAGCQRPFPSTPQVDHDHRCCPQYGSCGNCIRGLLCVNCNTALGRVNDDIAVLRNLICYLESWR